jgi:hypothetical protein
MDGSNLNNVNNVPTTPVFKKYEERVVNIMQIISDSNYQNEELVNSTQKKIEDELREVDKMIDEEIIYRTIGSHKINIALIGKLRELRYDFNQDKSNMNYENIINNAVNALVNLNNN